MNKRYLSSSFRICLFIFFTLTTCLLAAEETPDWAKRDFSAPADKVFAAALRSIQTQKHEVKWKDDSLRIVEFHVGTTAWSWGYNMRLTVKSIDEKRSVAEFSIARSGGKTFSWGKGSKEVNKIMAGMDAELTAAKAGLD